MIRDASVEWLMFIVAVWTCAVAIILLVAVTIGPELWRAGREQISAWLQAPEDRA